jgi:hypothetical protein
VSAHGVLWADDRPHAWAAALASYDAVVAAQGVARLPALDRWYHDALPGQIAARAPAGAHVTHDELVRVTEWKMARGVWRARNLVLVRGNAPAAVEAASRDAFAAVAAPGARATAPIAALAALAGVGPATASAVVAAAAPERYPFFDELVAAQVPGLGPVAFTLGYYARYAEALRTRAAGLGGPWTPARVERALWARVGGKAGAPGTDTDGAAAGDR